MTTSPSPRAVAALLALSFCWGSNYGLIKLALVGMPPATVTLGRLAFAALALLLLMRFQKHDWPRGPRAWLGMAGVGLFGNALPYFLIAAAETRVSSALAAILIAATPLITMVAAHWLARGEPLTLRRLLGVALGFAGIVVLVGPEALAGLGADLAGQLALLGAATGFAVSILIARAMPPLPIAVSGTGALLIGAVLVFPAAVLDGMQVAPPWQAIAATAALGLLSTAAAALLYFYLAKNVGANFTASANYLAPLVAAAFGIALLGERPGWHAGAALVLILLGTWTANRRT